MRWSDGSHFSQRKREVGHPPGLSLVRLDPGYMLSDLSLETRLANQQRRKRYRSTPVSALDVGSPGVAAPPHPGDLIPRDDTIPAKPAAWRMPSWLIRTVLGSARRIATSTETGINAAYNPSPLRTVSHTIRAAKATSDTVTISIRTCIRGASENSTEVPFSRGRTFLVERRTHQNKSMNGETNKNLKRIAPNIKAIAFT